MNLTDLKHQVEDHAVEYLNATRLEALEEKVLGQLRKSGNLGYVRLNKFEFSALVNAVRGLHRKRQELEADLTTSAGAMNEENGRHIQRISKLEQTITKTRQAVLGAREKLFQSEMSSSSESWILRSLNNAIQIAHSATLDSQGSISSVSSLNLHTDLPSGNDTQTGLERNTPGRDFSRGEE